MGDPGSRARARRRVRRRDSSLLLDGDRDDVRRARRRARRARRGRRGLLPRRRTRASGATACSTPACSSRSSGSRSSTTCGPRCSPARPSAEELLALARQLRDEDDLVVWRVLVSVLRGTVAARRRRRARPAAGRGRRRARAHVRAPRLAADRQARTRARASCAAWCSTRSGRSSRTRRRSRRARETVRERRAATPTSRPASVAIVASAGDADTFDEFVARARRRRRRRRSSCATSTRSGTFPTEELVLRAARARDVGRGAAAERPVRDPAGAAQPRARAARCGCSCATTGTTCAPGSRAR